MDQGRRKKSNRLNWLWGNAKPTGSWLLKQPNPVRVDHEKIQLRRYIGAGEHGAVYEATLGDDIPFAVKFLKELPTAGLPRHPNVVSVIGYSFEGEREHHILAMEKMDMNLEQYISKRRKQNKFPFVISESIWIMHEISKGLSYLESEKFLYSDFKVRNVLVNEREGLENEFKLSSACLNHYQTGYQEKPHGLSFSRVCYHILTGEVPETEDWELPPHCPERLQQLIRDKHSDIIEFSMALSEVAGVKGLSKVKHEGRKPGVKGLSKVKHEGRKQAPVMLLKLEDFRIGSVRGKSMMKQAFKEENASTSTPFYGQNGLRVFTSSDISSVRLLGMMSGGHSSVRRGRMADGLEVVLKHFASDDRGFLKEVQIQTNHRHLLSPIGYCAEGDRRILVFKYMPRSLESDLFHNEKLVLDWNQRINIAIGIAEGLECLHSYDIIHRSIKPKRILLDSNFEARVANFTFSCNKTEEIATIVRSWSRIMTLDVYRFGVLLLQLISGNQLSEDSSFPPGSYFVDWAANMVRGKREEELADPKLKGVFNSVQLKYVASLAIRCTRHIPEDRPTMHDAVLELKSLRLNDNPVKESLQLSDTDSISEPECGN